MTLTLLHKRIFEVCWKYIYRNFWLKIPGGYRTYRRLSHTVLSGIVSCVSIFWARCLMLVTYRYWLSVIVYWSPEWLSGLWNYTYVFYVFYKIQNMTFYVCFELLHTFSRTLDDTSRGRHPTGDTITKVQIFNTVEDAFQQNIGDSDGNRQISRPTKKWLDQAFI